MRRLRWGVAGAVTILVVAAGWWLATGDDPDPLAEAITIAEDDTRFGTGLEAADSFARIAGRLNEAIDRCDPERSGNRCAALGSASGYAQVLAAHVLRCTAPGRFEARTNLATLLVEVDELAPTNPVPRPAPLPACR